MECKKIKKDIWEGNMKMVIQRKLMYQNDKGNIVNIDEKK